MTNFVHVEVQTRICSLMHRSWAYTFQAGVERRGITGDKGGKRVQDVTMSCCK